ncbi:hypothetical protein V5N11_016015 [Cardamine amara subsp. amara]|uniref:Uncharacterized protein n=1 Tax=Cardamine amara subsp. amara TaxID=228776 RepID=A0ABD0ZHK5_CARAN
MIDEHTFVIHDGSDVSEDVVEEILANDPLEVALTKPESEHSFLSEDTHGFAKFLDSNIRVEEKDDFLSLVEGTKIDDKGLPQRASQPAQGAPAPGIPILGGPWSELKAPKLELKALPAGLRYTYPVIVNAELNNVEVTLLLCELRKYRKALGYSLDDITGISPDLCMHMNL